MMCRRSNAGWLTLIGFACALLAPAMLVDGQDAPSASSGEPVEGTFFDQLDLTVVNIDVHVTDKKGQPVLDLEKDDFVILEDGKPVDVTNFYAVAGGTPRYADALPMLATEAGGPAATLPTIEVPEDQRLSLIVYVDNLFIRPPSRNKVMREARGFLRRVLRGGDRAMVVSFDRSLHVRQPFTTDHRLVESALLELEGITGWGVQAATERSQVIRRLDNVRNAFEAEGHIESFANARYFEVRQTVKALKAQVASLAGLPGRKAVLYVSDGFPMTAAEDLYFLLDLRYPDQTGGQMAATRFRARRLIRELTFDANANRVTFYTVQAKGLRSHQSVSAETRSAGGSMIEVDSVYDSNFEAPLEMMARDTGGQAALGTNNIDGALERVANDFESYYSLGYAPVHAEQGKYHRVQVKVNRKGLKVRHRQGFRYKTVEERLTDATLAAVHFGAGSNSLGVRLKMGKARPENRGRFLVPLEVQIPISSLALIPRQAVFAGRLRVSMAIDDGKGEISPITVEPLSLQIPEDDLAAARGKHYVYAVELLMETGTHRVTVGVADDFAGETSFTAGAVKVAGG